MQIFPGVLSFVRKEITQYEDGRTNTFHSCGICGYKTKWSTNCNDHMLRKHAEPENISCEYCGEVIKYRPNLRFHQKTCKKKLKFKPF